MPSTDSPGLQIQDFSYETCCKDLELPEPGASVRAAPHRGLGVGEVGLRAQGGSEVFRGRFFPLGAYVFVTV